MPPDRLVPPSPRRRFVFYGFTAEIVLPDGMPTVALDYLAEPPHGDPQYKVSIDRVAVGGSATPIGFFARDLHLSADARYLALSSWHGARSFIHVIDLIARRYASRASYDLLEGVSDRAVELRRGDADRERGELQSIPFSRLQWEEIATPLPTTAGTRKRRARG